MILQEGGAVAVTSSHESCDVVVSQEASDSYGSAMHG